jgi:DUF4097 and DUF4098 domain-containing protein YvlB
MRTFIACVFATALILTPAFAAAATETFEWSGGAGARVLRLSHVVGKVDVAVGGDEVAVRATKKCEDADLLAAVRITAEVEGDAVIVGVEYPEDVEKKPGVTVDVDVTVPESLARAEVTSAAGSVKVAGVAEVAVSTASGNISVSGAYGEVDVRAASGGVVVDNAGKPTKRAAVTNVNGSVTLRLELPAAGADYEVTSVSGPVELALAGAADNYDITVSAVSGRVTSAFPLTSSGGPVGKTYSGRAGAATNEIAITTVSGSVNISASD